MHSNERLIGFFILFVVAIIFLSVILSVATGGIESSSGYREGFVQKFSHRCILVKTHEGQLGLHGFPMGVWEFSVTDPQVVSDLQQVHANELVRLHYKEKALSPFWYGATNYFITRVERVK